MAPYSFFNAISYYPHMIAFSSEEKKHSFTNAKAQAEFTFSLVSENLAHAMNDSSEPVPDGANEFTLAGLTEGRSRIISAPFVAESPAALECVTVSATQLRDRHGQLVDRHLVIGQVVETHIRDEFVVNGRFDTAAA